MVWTAGDAGVVAWMNNIDAPWTDYTPVFSASGSSPNIGTTGTVAGRYKQIGKTVSYSIKVACGGTGIAAGSGTYLYSPPVPGHASNGVVGAAWIYNGTFYVATANFFSTSNIQLVTPGGYQAAGVAQVVTAVGTVIRIAGTYEAA